MTDAAYKIVKATIWELRQDTLNEQMKAEPNEKEIAHNKKLIKDLCVEIVEHEFEKHPINTKQNGN